MCMVKCEYLKVCIMVACLSLFTTYGSKRGPKNQNTLTQRDYLKLILLTALITVTLRAFDIMSLLCCVWLKESCAPAVKGQRSGSSCGPRVLGRTR